MLHAFPTRFILYMLYAFLNRPFDKRRIKLGAGQIKKYIELHFTLTE